MFPLFPLAPIRWYAELQRIVGAAKICPGRGARMYKHLKWSKMIEPNQDLPRVIKHGLGRKIPPCFQRDFPAICVWLLEGELMVV